MCVKRLTLLGLLLSVTGCASVPRDAPPYTRLADASNGKAHLYFFRLGAYPKVRTPSVLVDGRLIFDPPEEAYTVIALPIGIHKVKIDWAWDTGFPDLEFPINLEEGKPLYLKITGSFKDLGRVYRLGSEVVPMKQDAAEEEIRKCCRYVAPQY